MTNSAHHGDKLQLRQLSRGLIKGALDAATVRTHCKRNAARWISRQQTAGSCAAYH